VQADHSRRQAGEILGVADRPLHRHGREQQPAQPDRPRRRAGQLQPDRERESEAAEQPADVGVKLRDAAERQVIPGRCRVARERACSRDHGPSGEHQARYRDHHAAEHAQVGPHERAGGCRVLAAPHVEHDRHRDDRHGDEKVHGDHGRVERGQHGDAAEHRLQDDAGGLRGREPHQVGAARQVAVTAIGP